ncbi:MAG: hypothetical protein ACE37D_05045 [Pseudomonadales bacterium]|jgi:hypothetical protein
MSHAKKSFIATLMLVTMFSLQGCWFAAGAATGAAVHEAMDENGYEIGSPIKRDDDD